MTHIDITRLKANTTILLETTSSVYSFKVVNPSQRLVEVTTSFVQLKDRGPVACEVIEAIDPTNGEKLTGMLKKGWAFSLRFADAVLLSEPVESALIEGEDEGGNPWKYEAFE